MWTFFGLALGISWTFWAVAIALGGNDVWETPGRWFIYLGGLGPPLAGVVLIYATGGIEALRELLPRLLDPRRIPLPWLAVALLLPVLAMLGAIAVVALLPGTSDASVDATRLHTLLRDPLSFVAFTLFVLVFGPLPEEIGWRGYALDALRVRQAALPASLVLGSVWALWHAPLFFVPGYFGAEGTPPPVLFTTAIIVHSVLFTWIYEHTARSVLVAVLFHFVINFVGMLLEGDARVEWTRTVLTAAVAIAVALHWTLERPHS